MCVLLFKCNEGYVNIDDETPTLTLTFIGLG